MIFRELTFMVVFVMIVANFNRGVMTEGSCRIAKMVTDDQRNFGREKIVYDEGEEGGGGVLTNETAIHNVIRGGAARASSR